MRIGKKENRLIVGLWNPTSDTASEIIYHTYIPHELDISGCGVAVGIQNPDPDIFVRIYSPGDSNVLAPPNHPVLGMILDRPFRVEIIFED